LGKRSQETEGLVGVDQSAGSTLRWVALSLERSETGRQGPVRYVSL